MMKTYILKFLQNLLIVVVLSIAMGIFLAIFYPKTLPIFWTMGKMYTGLNLWPIIILSLVLMSLPKKSSRRNKK